jgi:predicted nucleic acid-binding protein
MPLVVDASVMANWHFDDERNAWSEAILDRLQDRRDRARVPGIWWFELHHVLLRGERRHRATLQQSMEFQRFIEDLPIDVAPNAGADAVMILARRHRLSFYDAAYLELAQRENIPLATLDQALQRAAAAEGVPLIAA